MEERGSKQVQSPEFMINGRPGITKSRDILPPAIYVGKTEICLPQNVEFPSDLDVTFTEVYWSIESVDKVIVPY